MQIQADSIIGCDVVNTLVSTPIPPTLWHYTSYGGFCGIVSSKKIWATEYRFLNDREEVRHTKELAQALVEEEPESVGNFGVRNTIRSAVNMVFASGSLHEQRLNVFVASFTQAEDQLSQWRGYANDSRGVSVGFNLQSLRPPANPEIGVTFAPCVYEQEEKRALLKAIFSHYVKGIQEKWWDPLMDKAKAEGKQAKAEQRKPTLGEELVSRAQKELRETVHHCLAILQFDLMRTAPLLKNQSFAEEREWRLVFPWMPESKLPKRLEFRSVADTVVPHIAWPFNLEDKDAPVPCTDLILGPGSHPSAEIGVDLFLQKERIAVKPRRSKIPYRPT